MSAPDAYGVRRLRDSIFGLPTKRGDSPSGTKSSSFDGKGKRSTGVVLVRPPALPIGVRLNVPATDSSVSGRGKPTGVLRRMVDDSLSAMADLTPQIRAGKFHPRKHLTFAGRTINIPITPPPTSTCKPSRVPGCPAPVGRVPSLACRAALTSRLRKRLVNKSPLVTGGNQRAITCSTCMVFT